MKITNDVAWHETGFRAEVLRVEPTGDRMLKIGSLNPEQEIKEVMSRWDCARLGWLILRRAVFS